MTSPTYHAAFDVYYYDNYAVVGYVLFENQNSELPFLTGQYKHESIEPYVSGEFYKRELPCVLGAINSIKEKINIIYIDAYVWLDDNKKGLGKYLFDKLDKTIPIISVSKSSFNSNTNRIKPLLRASSNKPLYISSEGIDLENACDMVKNMNGEFRLPTMIKLADQVCRKVYVE